MNIAIMRWKIIYKPEDEAVFAQLSEDDFWCLEEEILHKNTLFYKKREFHVTLFWWRWFFSQNTSKAKDEICSILSQYQDEQVDEISIGDQMYHIQKGAKESLISKVYAPSIWEIITDISDRMWYILREKQLPFLHTTLYTNKEFPSGIGLPTLSDFEKYKVV